MTKCTWLVNKHNIHKGVQENDVSVKMCMCTVLLLTMVQVLYLLEVFILAHYGPPSTETPTAETTTVRCHKNSWIYLTSTYYWWLLRRTITIRFDSKFQIIAQLFDLIRNEKNTIRYWRNLHFLMNEKWHFWRQNALQPSECDCVALTDLTSSLRLRGL